MLSVCCVLWTTVEPPDVQWRFLLTVRYGEQSVNFVTMSILMYPGLEPKRVLDHVTLKQLDHGIKRLQASIPILIKKNTLKQW